MKKSILSLLAFASILSLSVCNTSCSDDDDDDNSTPTQNTDSKATTDAKTVSDDILNYVAADNANYVGRASLLNDLQNAISGVQTSNDTTYKNAVIAKVAEATGLTTENATSIINNAGGVSGLATIFTNLSDEQKKSILTNAKSYADGYSDSQDLAKAYATLANTNSTIEEKTAALDQLESDIKNHYQPSTDTVYKKTYVTATAAATGLSETIVKQILESNDPKATAASLLGVTLTTEGGGESAEQGTSDAKAAADVVSSLQGKNVLELMNNTETIAKITSYKTAYENGSDEYKAAFKQGLIDNGVSDEVISLLSTDGEIDYISLANALGITL